MATRKSTSKRTAPLAEYRRKRDFSRTAEPEGAGTGTNARKALRFVVQKHAASHLHFDFRLELDGVMKSWAVPKGPSYDPGVRRLAMQVEDHPIDYNTFEGTIPQGEYGGGTVMLWDRGTYEPENGGGVDALRDGYERGDLKILLHGKRLQGGWVLVRMRRDDSDRAQWLLIKHRDETADPDHDVVGSVTTSVASGRSMEAIAARKGRVWKSNRSDAVTSPARKKRTVAAKPRRTNKGRAKVTKGATIKRATNGAAKHPTNGAAKHATKRATKRATARSRS
jgi:bifunctional non-homologous end joining protein LigD